VVKSGHTVLVLFTPGLIWRRWQFLSYIPRWWTNEMSMEHWRQWQWRTEVLGAKPVYWPRVQHTSHVEWPGIEPKST